MPTPSLCCPHQGIGLFFAVALCLPLPLLASAAPVTGGFSQANTQHADVIKAARFAIAQRKQQTGNKLALQKIEHAQTQVVAGLNFQLCLKVKQTKPSQTLRVAAKVYQNLDQQMQLSQWEVVPSCPKAAHDTPKTE